MKFGRTLAVVATLAAVPPVSGIVGEHMAKDHAVKDHYGHVHSVADRSAGLASGLLVGGDLDLLLLVGTAGYKVGRKIGGHEARQGAQVS